MDTLRDDYTDNTRVNTIPAEEVEGHHESDGTLGEVAGTGAGALSGGVVGAAIGGPIGAVIGAVAGGVLGAAGGEAAHKIGDDHDDVNLSTGSDGELGRDSGVGVGAVAGTVLGGVAGGPVGAVGGAVAGGLLGAEAGDAAKHVGENDPVDNAYNSDVYEPTLSDTRSTLDDATIGNGVPGIQTGGYAADGTPDTRGITEKAADEITGDVYDDKTGRVVR